MEFCSGQMRAVASVCLDMSYWFCEVFSVYSEATDIWNINTGRKDIQATQPPEIKQCHFYFDGAAIPCVPVFFKTTTWFNLCRNNINAPSLHLCQTGCHKPTYTNQLVWHHCHDCHCVWEEILRYFFQFEHEVASTCYLPTAVPVWPYLMS